MDGILLRIPTAADGEQIMAFRREILAANDADSFAGCMSLDTCESAEEYLAILEKRRDPAAVPPGNVPSDVYLAIRVSDGRLVGIIDLRHHIDHPILSVWGGHIGYTVRPSERGKGYAAEMLRLNLENCRRRGMTKILITCSPENTASEKTILANGGVLVNEILVDGDRIRRYWITL